MYCIAWFWRKGVFRFGLGEFPPMESKGTITSHDSEKKQQKEEEERETCVAVDGEHEKWIQGETKGERKSLLTIDCMGLLSSTCTIKNTVI